MLSTPHPTVFTRPPQRLPSLSRPLRKPSDENASFNPPLVSFDPSSPRDHSHDKALLIAAQQFPDAPPLSTPHSDQKAVYNDLLSKGFKPGNIHCMNENNVDPYWHPTKENIIREFMWLPLGVEPGDFVVLHLAGHAIQVPCTTGSEEDGQDEAFVTIDEPQPNTRNNLVLDNVIRRMVVNALPGGSFLLAILDTCSSGTLLDLDSTTQYTPRPWPVGKDPESPTLPSPLLTPPPKHETLMQVLSPQQSRQNSLSANSDPSTPLVAHGSPIVFQRSMSPDPPDRRRFAQVLSISACQDGQTTWSRDKTMVTHLLRLLNKHDGRLHNGKRSEPLTPKVLEQKLNKKMLKSRVKELKAHMQSCGMAWTDECEERVRGLQTPKITTLPDCVDILDKPFTMLTPALQGPVTRASN